MATVTLLADPKFEGRAAGSPGGIAARGVIGEKNRPLRAALGALFQP